MVRRCGSAVIVLSQAGATLRGMEFIGDLERAFAATIYPNRFLLAVVGIVVLAVLALVARRRGWHRAAARHPGRTAAVVVAAFVIGGPLGWYLGSPLFLSTTIDEPPPVAAVEASAPPPSATASPSGSSDVPTPSIPSALPQEPTPSPTPTIALLERAGGFRGADDFHFGEGTARLIETAPGSFTLRLEDFAVRNGPDLYVYLSPDADGYADGAIELGRLKADRGNQNYEVPDGIDVSSAASVVIWCRQFSVQFATASLAEA